MYTIEQSTEQEFTRLYRQTSRKAFNLAYRLIGDRTEAEDIAQEAYARAWRHFDQYDRDRSFDNWLLRIVTNVAFDLARRRRLVRFTSLESAMEPPFGSDCLPIDFPDPDGDPEAAAIAGTLGESLEAALATLTPAHRDAVMLAFVSGLTYEAIASRIGCPVGTVRTRIHRGREVLRKRLEKSAA